MKYETVIGLEVHVEMATETKIFCACKNKFGSEPNTNVCPVCLSMPGTLPVLNMQAVEYGVRAGLSLNCEIQIIPSLTGRDIFIRILQRHTRFPSSIFRFVRAGRLSWMWMEKSIR